MKKVVIRLEKEINFVRSFNNFLIYRSYKYRDLPEVLKIAKNYTDNIQIITCKGTLKRHIKRIEAAGYTVKTVSEVKENDPIYQEVTITI